MDTVVGTHKEDLEGTVRIEVAASDKIGFVSQQNAVPPLREIKLVNEGEDDLSDLRLNLSADPAFLRERSWRIDHLPAGESLQLRDRDVTIAAGFARDLAEAENGTVKLELRDAEGFSIATSMVPITILAVDDWGGADAMPELLPAFVMPNDPAVEKVMRAAAQALAEAGKPDRLDGYESGDKARVYEIISAIWSAVSGLELTYALPPASFETRGQKIRSPAAIYSGRVATCLDTALLFAAAIEQAGLHPLIVLTQGHAFAGAWVERDQFSELVTDEVAAVRNRLDLGNIVLFETTMVTGANRARFSQACAESKRQIDSIEPDDVFFAVDVRRARMRKILPLATSTTQMEAEDEGVASVSVETAPALYQGSIESVEIDEEESHAKDRIEEWQRKLLDLTARNRLLNLPRAGNLNLICPDPARLEDLLAEGKKISVAPLPDLGVGGRDIELHRDRSRNDLKEEHALAGLEKNEVFVELEKPKLDASLIKIYRQARADLNEGGSNTLFLAFGFLEWKKKEADQRSYRAPLILQPVRLERRNARSAMKLTAHEDEPRFNMTLLELLKQDFGLFIGGLDGELPKDESGTDVAGVWRQVRLAITNTPGFEVREQVTLGIFSFSKYLMWKDLVDRRELLKENRVVRHLIERGSEAFAGCGPLPEPRSLDREVDPADLYAPLPADSSQLAAVVASGQGHDFVLDGPPGTGKSQTIANMIAQNLALGRRVLFVSEKRAALDVVYRRLEQTGLGDFCLELHSHKSAKIEVLRQLERAWNAKGALSQEEWAAKTSELKRLRDDLNEFASALHHRHPCGLTVHDAVWRVVRDDDGALPEFAWPASKQHGEAEMKAMRAAVRSLELTYASLAALPRVILDHVHASEWSNAWQSRLLATARELRSASEGMERAAQEAGKASGLGAEWPGPGEADRLLALCRAICETAGLDLAFAFRPDHAEKIGGLRRLATTVREWHTNCEKLSSEYGATAAIEEVHDALAREWEEVHERFVLLRSFAVRGFIKRMSQLGHAAGNIDVAADLPVFREMARLRTKSGELGAVVEGVTASRGLESDPERLEQLADAAEAIRAAARSHAHDPEDFATLLISLRTAVVDANEMVAPDAPLGMATQALAVAAEEFTKARAAFLEASASDALPSAFEQIVKLCDDIEGRQVQLNALCQWNGARSQAAALGLTPMTERVAAGLEMGKAVPLFDAAYAKWFAPWAIDSEPRLAGFHSLSHEDKIRAFGKVTEEVQKLTAGIIRARLCTDLPEPSQVARASGFGVLKHELAKQRAHKPVRQLAEEMGKDFSALAPCMLMSPLSIAQYLPADQDLFDIVIFDEASQITPWDAVGSIGRGRQLVLAGDQKQMPPTNFFSRGSATVDEDAMVDLESILDECVSAAIPRRSLDWHYRSRHDSLIAFSNSRYYNGKLVTFPAPETRETAVEWHRVEGIYAKGTEQTNAIEAKAIVAEAKKRLAQKAPGEASLGIVTLNSKQQELIEDLLEQARKGDAAFDAHFADDLEEPVFVKNLETVQGDERDIIILGITFGPVEPDARKMSMNFGPLNKDGGWRRLNVAITRARKEMLLFTSFDAGMIDLSRTASQAVRDLKHYIEFAERGPRALAEAHSDSIGTTESPFEDAVKGMLERRGWSVRPQIGVSGYRIDLGVVDPDSPGDFLAGIECDGAMYHSALTARDRDKVRQAVLEGLGWTILRIWSTDFWIDARGAMGKIDASLSRLLEEARERRAATETKKDNLVIDSEAAADTSGPDDAFARASRDAEITAGDHEADAEDGDELSPPDPQNVESREPVLIMSSTADAPPARAVPYRHADLSVLTNRIDPDRFYDAGYDEVLAELVRIAVETEAPIREDQLATIIAREHGFARTGRLIRERVSEMARRSFAIVEDEEEQAFVWIDESQALQLEEYRVPPNGNAERSIDQIALPELMLVARAVDDSDDRAIAVARTFAILRLRKDARRRVELAIQKVARQ